MGKRERDDRRLMAERRTMSRNLVVEDDESRTKSLVAGLSVKDHGSGIAPENGAPLSTPAAPASQVGLWCT
jgi:hypothetical protein